MKETDDAKGQVSPSEGGSREPLLTVTFCLRKRIVIGSPYDK